MTETIRVDLTAQDPYAKPVQEVMARLGMDSVLSAQRRIVIKPNLVTEAAPPVTTDVRCVEALARFCLACSGADVVVAEGSGGADTCDCFNTWAIPIWPTAWASGWWTWTKSRW